MVWLIILFHVVLMVAAFVLLAMSWIIFEEVEALTKCIRQPKVVCQQANELLPCMVGLHWSVTIVCLIAGHPYLALYNLPLGLLYIFQYGQRVPDSGYGYLNPIRFYSQKYLNGLQHVYLILCFFYLFSMLVYFVNMVMDLINAP